MKMQNMKMNIMKGRPKIEDPVDMLDAYNLRHEGTQFVKSIKIRESTYNVLHDLKTHNDNVKSVDDAIMHCVLITAMHIKD